MINFDHSNDDETFGFAYIVTIRIVSRNFVAHCRTRAFCNPCSMADIRPPINQLFNRPIWPTFDQSTNMADTRSQRIHNPPRTLILFMKLMLSLAISINWAATRRRRPGRTWSWCLLLFDGCWTRGICSLPDISDPLLSDGSSWPGCQRWDSRIV